MTQKTSQCCRCCCLQPNIHWQYAPLTEEIVTLSQSSGVGAAIQGKTHMHVQEDAPYCGRTLSWCYPGFRRAPTASNYPGNRWTQGV